MNPQDVSWEDLLQNKLEFCQKGISIVILIFSVIIIELLYPYFMYLIGIMMFIMKLIGNIRG